MKRRPTAATVASRPIEFFQRRFFLLVVRDAPRASLDLATRTREREHGPLCLPRTPGIAFVELETTLLEPRDRETRLDAAHTIRFCRFMDATRRQHTTVGDPPPATSTGVGRSSQVHFVTRSQVRGDEVVVVQLLIRWRLICLQLSPVDAIAPFLHLAPLFHSRAVNLEQALAGITKGIACDLLFSRQAFLDNDNNDVDPFDSMSESCFTRITTRFLLFASPIDQPVNLATTKVSEASEIERPPTVDSSSSQPSGSLAHDEDDPALLQRPTPSLPRLSVTQLASQLKQHRVAMVVKLNASPRYDDQLIIRSGVDHLDLSGRSDAEGVDRNIVARFLESCEHSSPHSVVAVHSSTGLGRAAFCVACFLIKHAQFSAAEAIGWLRFCCPDALPVWYEPQLLSMEKALARDGDEFRRRRLAAQEELQQRGGSPRSTFSRLSLNLGLLGGTALATTLDDLALASPSSARLASQISIGQITLGRESLLGTKDKSSSSRRDRETASPSPKALSPAQVLPLQRGGVGGSYRDLVASDAVLGAQATRRPLTQGAGGRRRLLDHHHHHHHTHHGDFATLHKFLHQSTGSPARSSSSGQTTPYRGPPQRPTATAPDRTMSSTLFSTLPTTTTTTTTRGVHASEPTQQHTFD